MCCCGDRETPSLEEKTSDLDPDLRRAIAAAGLDPDDLPPGTVVVDASGEVLAAERQH